MDVATFLRLIVAFGGLREGKMSNTEKLKPCPFCGERAEVFEFDHGSRFIVECENPNCDVHPYTSIHETKQDAISAWNKRTGDAE